jgi:hypothetical protein
VSVHISGLGESAGGAYLDAEELPFTLEEIFLASSLWLDGVDASRFARDLAKSAMD